MDTVKYENIFLHDYADVREVTAGLKRYFRFYNHERPHQSLGNLGIGLLRMTDKVRLNAKTRRPLSRRLLLMSFEGMGKSIQKGESADRVVGAPFHPLDEFPASYSLTRCSPAELVSASPAENDFTGERIQLRGFFINRKSKNAGHESTLNTLFFGPKNGEPLNV